MGQVTDFKLVCSKGIKRRMGLLCMRWFANEGGKILHYDIRIYSACAGYHLVVVKQSDCNVDSLTRVVQSHIPTAELESVINAEVSYILPDSESARFPALFTELDNHKNQLGIISFGTSATTMEEVFLNVRATIIFTMVVMAITINIDEDDDVSDNDDEDGNGDDDRDSDVNDDGDHDDSVGDGGDEDEMV
ncbi:ATP-binding cassette sub-family a member 3 [Plakobranchus ocellatus]|uniref:ATP-binding cassette sub-family a member 3 n=1 Tax=Plakobranchus ocellatus TaxID=259542 RepID=A0AAV4C8M6_9GAST|nr:ATP-binding cassette sub-family a member 3 [Plakobranchus ocellatus]